jgi:hypothetical protein
VRRLVLGLTLACLLTLHAAPAEAGRNAMGYVLYGSFVDPTIEQQTDLPFGSGNVVTNPYRATPCAWDVDDHWYSIAEGTLRAGQSLTKTECVVSSPAGFFVSVNGNWGWYYYALGWYGVQVKADVGTLDVRVCYDVEDYCITATPTQLLLDGGVGRCVHVRLWLGRLRPRCAGRVRLPVQLRGLDRGHGRRGR